MTQHSPDPAERLDESELRGLKTALRAMFRSQAHVIDCQAQPLKGGTVGQVRLITGLTHTEDAGRQLPGVPPYAARNQSLRNAVENASTSRIASRPVS